MNNRKLVLENGKVFEGIGFGSFNNKIAEIVFNTAVVGYQEILSDPVYCDQMVCMCYPLIGNYGLTDEDYESKHIKMKAMIVREYNDLPSNFRYTSTLAEVMEENDVAGLSGVDTRELTRIIRDNGTMKAMICDIDKPLEECLSEINNYVDAKNKVATVSCKKVWYSRTPNPMFNVVVIDCGLKVNLIKKLNKEGCNVVVVPYNTSALEILKYNPNGVLVSSGTGCPNENTEIVETIKNLVGKLPILGVGLGQHLIALAYGAEVYKMNCGHHGSNHPVRKVETGKVEITSQNYNYTVCKESLKNTDLVITHEHVITGEVEGLTDKKNSVISIQYEPSTPIDESCENIFAEFVSLIKNFGGKDNA